MQGETKLKGKLLFHLTSPKLWGAKKKKSINYATKMENNITELRYTNFVDQFLYYFTFFFFFQNWTCFLLTRHRLLIYWRGLKETFLEPLRLRKSVGMLEICLSAVVWEESKIYGSASTLLAVWLKVSVYPKGPSCVVAALPPRV